MRVIGNRITLIIHFTHYTLLQVNGNFHFLIGLYQVRYQYLLSHLQQSEIIIIHHYWKES